MSHQLPPDPDPATGFIALLLPALPPPLLCSFIASGQDRTDKGLRTERSISVGADMDSKQPGPGKFLGFGPPIPFDMFPPGDGEKKGLGD